jgi:hypothetical protein
MEKMLIYMRALVKIKNLWFSVLMVNGFTLDRRATKTGITIRTLFVVKDLDSGTRDGLKRRNGLQHI